MLFTSSFDTNLSISSSSSSSSGLKSNLFPANNFGTVGANYYNSVYHFENFKFPENNKLLFMLHFLMIPFDQPKEQL